MVGSNFEEYCNTLRKVVWVSAVAACCYFMVDQVKTENRSTLDSANSGHHFSTFTGLFPNIFAFAPLKSL